MSKKILNYLQAYWDDLHHWIEGQEEVDSVNNWTNGTPCFENIEEARTYMDELEKTMQALSDFQDRFRKPMTNESFIDEMRTIAFGASETRHEYSLEEVCHEILQRSNEHYRLTELETNNKENDDE